MKDNRAAFDVFMNAFYPRIGTFRESLLRDETRQGCAFEGVVLTGLPHFSVIDEEGKQRFVYLHASKWTEDDLKAYLELLSVIVEERLGLPSTSIWCMDLRTGLDYKWKTSVRVRARCANAARHFARLMEAMQSV